MVGRCISYWIPFEPLLEGVSTAHCSHGHFVAIGWDVPPDAGREILVLTSKIYTCLGARGSQLLNRLVCHERLQGLTSPSSSSSSSSKITNHQPPNLFPNFQPFQPSNGWNGGRPGRWGRCPLMRGGFSQGKATRGSVQSITWLVCASCSTGWFREVCCKKRNGAVLSPVLYVGCFLHNQFLVPILVVKQNPHVPSNLPQLQHKSRRIFTAEIFTSRLACTWARHCRVRVSHTRTLSSTQERCPCLLWGWDPRWSVKTQRNTYGEMEVNVKKNTYLTI